MENYEHELGQWAYETMTDVDSKNLDHLTEILKAAYISEQQGWHDLDTFKNINAAEIDFEFLAMGFLDDLG